MIFKQAFNSVVSWCNIKYSLHCELMVILASMMNDDDDDDEDEDEDDATACSRHCATFIFRMLS